MSKLWAPIDKIAEWVQNGVDVEIQQRLAVLAILVSIPLMVYGPVSGEQLLIYEMSALALTLTGITWLASLVAAKKAEESGDGEDTTPAQRGDSVPPPVP
jgi:hypothetical protein